MILKELVFEIVSAKEVSNKSLGQLQYFLGIEVAGLKKVIFLSQWKYMLNMLSKDGMLWCKPVESPVDANSKLLPD